MTVAVAGVWELGWNTPIKEIELWEYPLRDFGIDAFYMTPVSGIHSSAVVERHTIEEILSENEDLVHVFVDERGTHELPTFSHPRNALYIFGKASLSLHPMARPGDITLRIPTPHNLATLWPHQCAALVLYDRFMKEQGD